MSELINIGSKEGKLVVSSREIAKNFEKEHKHVMEAVRNLMAENSTVKSLVIESEYVNSRGQAFAEYLLTRDGFTLLAMGFTGKKALEWKLKYIEVFNKMEKELTAPRKLSAIEQLRLQNEVLDDHDERLGYLENNMTVDFGQQRKLQDKAKSKAIKCLGGMNSPAYKDRGTRSKTFASIWKDYKDYFQIGSYRDTSRVDFDKAMNYLHDWQAPGRLLRDIEDCNRQIGLEA